MGSSMTTAEKVPSSSFKVSDVKAEIVNRNKDSSGNPSICSQLMPYGKNHCTEVLMETPFSERVHASPKNGFVKTVIECYNNHHNLVIRPDDIWTAILTQFSFYINKNAEEFRKQFVNFDGKKELVVSINGSIRSAPYDIFVAKMTEKIHENLVDGTVKDWILPNFTTTTQNDFLSCGVIFMATMKKYFEFTFCLMCGIPNITLEGTVEDWENIQKRLEKLKAYKLEKWYDMLKLILDQFVAAKKGNVKKDFWNRICHHTGGGSGPTFISGWLTAFAVFDEEGIWKDCGEETWPKIDIDKIPSGIVSVDVNIADSDTEYEGIMFAGHIATEVLEDQFTLKPQIGWGIALKLNLEEKDALHDEARGN